MRGKRAAGEEARVGTGAENFGLVCLFFSTGNPFQAPVTICDVV